jgi:hypothetical protein
MIDFTYIILFLLTIPVHEGGHYLAFRYFGYKPSFRLTWYGAILIGENCYKNIPIKNMVFIAAAGPIAGLIVAVWDPVVFLFYILSCLIDFIHLFVYLYLALSGEDVENMTIRLLERKQKNKKNDF